MNTSENNIDANLIIQVFQEKLNQLNTELVVKEALIRHLNVQIQDLNNYIMTIQPKQKIEKNKKENTDEFE